MTTGGCFSDPHPNLPFKVPPFNPLYDDFHRHRLRRSTYEIQTRDSNWGSLRVSHTSMRNLPVTTSYRHTSTMMSETKGYHPMFAAIGFNWLVGVSEAIMKNPELVKGPMAKILTALSAFAPKWGPVLSSLIFLGYLQKAYSRKKNPEQISFGDLVGLTKEKASLDLVMKSLKRDPQLERFGEKSPGGVLLFGPEQTSKETLVNALAYDAKVSYFPITAPDIAREGASKGVATIQSLFLEARLYSRCLIYIKDVDAIAEKKPTGSNPILLELVKEMEKCHRDGCLVIVIGSTTKKPKELDAGLMRSELFLEVVHVEMPDENARRGFVELYLGQYLGEEIKEDVCTLIVSETKHFVRNDISKVCKLAKSKAQRKDAKLVTSIDVIDALAMVKPNVTTSVASEEQVTK